MITLIAGLVLFCASITGFLCCNSLGDDWAGLFLGVLGADVLLMWVRGLEMSQTQAEDEE